MRTVLVIRAEPGAAQTAARAADFDLQARSIPLFAARATDWTPPDSRTLDAVMLTSAQAPRLAGAGQADLLHLPCYAVGEGTARAARRAGYTDVRTGHADGAALLGELRRDGRTHVLHLRGRDHVDYGLPDVTIVSIPVYAVDGIEALPSEAVDVLASGPVVLLHSPRAARHFADLCGAAGIARDAIDLAAISEAARDAAGHGWKRTAVAPRPRDEALLELAAKLCKTGGA